MSHYKTTDEYIKAQSEDVAKRLTSIRQLFHKLLPSTEESIKYDIPAFSVGSHYLFMSAYKDHIGFYPMYGIPELDSEMLPYRGKGTKDALHFKHTEPLPMDLIEKIILAKAKK